MLKGARPGIITKRGITFVEMAGVVYLMTTSCYRPFLKWEITATLVLRQVNLDLDVVKPHKNLNFTL